MSSDPLFSRIDAALTPSSVDVSKSSAKAHDFALKIRLVGRAWTCTAGRDGRRSIAAVAVNITLGFDATTNGEAECAPARALASDLE
jgi:hypothetical protein